MKKFERKYLYKPNMTIFEQIIKKVGGIKKLEVALKKTSKEGTSLSTLRYVKTSNKMSPQLAVILEKFTNSEITRETLLPNLFKK